MATGAQTCWRAQLVHRSGMSPRASLGAQAERRSAEHRGLCRSPESGEAQVVAQGAAVLGDAARGQRHEAHLAAADLVDELAAAGTAYVQAAPDRARLAAQTARAHARRHARGAVAGAGGGDKADLRRARERSERLGPPVL